MTEAAQVPQPRPGAEPDAASAALDEAVGLALRVLKAVMVAVVGLFLASGLFTVQPHEAAFVRQRGRLDPEARQPGAHWSWPVLDEVVRVDLRPRRHATEAFDLARTPEERVTGATPRRQGGLDPRLDGYLLTGDGNVVHVALEARLSQAAPYRALVALGADHGPVVEALLERAAVQAAAVRPVEALLGAGSSFKADVQRRLQDALDGLDTGLRVDVVASERDAITPPQVRQAFDQEARAGQQRDAARSAALTAAARLGGEAVARAARIESEARTRARSLVEEARADAAVFRALRAERQRDPAALRERLLGEVLTRALGRVEEVFLLEDQGALRLRLGRDPRALTDELEREARLEAGVAPAPPQGGGRR